MLRRHRGRREPGCTASRLWPGPHVGSCSASARCSGATGMPFSWSGHVGAGMSAGAAGPASRWGVAPPGGASRTLQGAAWWSLESPAGCCSRALPPLVPTDRSRRWEGRRAKGRKAGSQGRSQSSPPGGRGWRGPGQAPLAARGLPRGPLLLGLQPASGFWGVWLPGSSVTLLSPAACSCWGTPGKPLELWP